MLAWEWADPGWVRVNSSAGQPSSIFKTLCYAGSGVEEIEPGWWWEVPRRDAKSCEHQQCPDHVDHTLRQLSHGGEQGWCPVLVKPGRLSESGWLSHHGGERRSKPYGRKADWRGRGDAWIVSRSRDSTVVGPHPVLLRSWFSCLENLEDFTRDLATNSDLSRAISGKGNRNLEFLIFCPSFCSFPLQLKHCI